MIFFRNIFTKHHVAFSSSVLILLVNSEHRETFFVLKYHFFCIFSGIGKTDKGPKVSLRFHNSQK